MAFRRLVDDQNDDDDVKCLKIAFFLKVIILIDEFTQNIPEISKCFCIKCACFLNTVSL